MAYVNYTEANVREMAGQISNLLEEAETLRSYLRKNLDAIIARKDSEEYKEHCEEYGFEDCEWLDYLGADMKHIISALDTVLDEAAAIYHYAEYDIKEIM
jgi:hypothetical protein